MISKIDKIIQAIEKGHIPHREYLRVRRLAYTHASLATPGTVIFIVGPSRVGKSRICKALKTELERGSPNSGIPVIRAEAVIVGNARSIMKHLMLRLLKDIKHPLYLDPYSMEASPESYRPRLGSTESILRTTLESAIEYRRTRWILIDEAHHLVRTHSDALAKNNLDSLKSLGNEHNVVLIIVGGYELLQRGFLSSHLNGRVRFIHFPRYGDSQKDTEVWVSALGGLSKHLPFRKGASLLNLSEYLNDGTVGSFGAVVTWTFAALAEMEARGGRFLRHTDYENTRLGIQRDSNREETEMGEELAKNLLRQSASGSDETCCDKTEQQGQRTNGTPFRRKLGRDPVGC